MDQPLPADIIPPHDGLGYFAVLALLHHVLKPSTYMEVGVNTGSTLMLASCASLAVDPRFLIDANVIGDKPICLFFQMDSDRFFRNYDPKALLGREVDLAFLDGMHLFEFLLRDFINAEKACRRNSVIVLHDCIPTDIYMTRRDPLDPEIVKLAPIPSSWTGDVWKTVLALRHYRPDLRLTCLDSGPTGLVLVTNLDPKSTVLDDQYYEAVDRFGGLEMATYGIEQYTRSLDLVSTSRIDTVEKMARLFWL